MNTPRKKITLLQTLAWQGIEPGSSGPQAIILTAMPLKNCLAQHGMISNHIGNTYQADHPKKRQYYRNNRPFCLCSALYPITYKKACFWRLAHPEHLFKNITESELDRAEVRSSNIETVFFYKKIIPEFKIYTLKE